MADPLAGAGDRVLVLMRGAPGSGKSRLAHEILAAHGARGVVLSTDDFFAAPEPAGGGDRSNDAGTPWAHGPAHAQPPAPAATTATSYLFVPRCLPAAHAWNMHRALQAVKLGLSPIVIDNTHMQRWEAEPYVRLAMAPPPASPGVLGAPPRHAEHHDRNQGHNQQQQQPRPYSVVVVEPSTPWWISRDVDELARRNSHGVGPETIRQMLGRYEADFSVESILADGRDRR
nr:NEDD4-binding protein 2 [Polyrhizophydium stewartii]